MASKHLFVANEIGLFERLALGPCTLDDLATSLGVPRRTVRILADAMVALGLVKRDGDRYCNEAVAQKYLSGLTADDLRPLLRTGNRISYPAWLQLEEAVRNGAAPARLRGFTEEEQRIFSQGVEAFTGGPARALARTHPFGDHQRILDVGGGTGSLLLAILGEHPHLRATVFELPGAAAVARARLADEPKGSAIEVVAGDFLAEPLPTGYDVVLLANVVHLLSPEQNHVLLLRARAAVAAGARALLVDFWTDPTHTQPLTAALMAGEFLMMTGEGEAYSEHEVRTWLTASGWRPLEHRPLTGAASLLVAEAV